MFDFQNAIVRTPGPEYSNGLTTRQATAFDYETILEQHRAYVQKLKVLGLEVHSLPPSPEYPDAYFVEDTALLFPDLAVITRPGAPARRGETESIRPALSGFPEVREIRAPGTLDGGDVLYGGTRVWVGISRRTNREGFRQLAEILKTRHIRCTAIPLQAGLHLKSGVNWIEKNHILVTPELADREEWNGLRITHTSPGESESANVLRIRNSLLFPAGFPATAERLMKLGIPADILDVSEVRKMDGGLTCMSLRY